MGKIIQLTCPACRKNWQLRTGHGLMHATLDNVLSAFPQEMQDQIRNKAGLPASAPATSASVSVGSIQRQTPSFEFQYRISICPVCRGPVSIPVLKLQNAGNANQDRMEAQSYIGSCPDCGAPVQAAEEDDGILCPVCSLTTLTTQTIGSWD